VSICRTKKRAYVEQAAERAAERVGQRAYLCPLCGFWHLTKQEFVDTRDTDERPKIRATGKQRKRRKGRKRAPR